MERYSNAPDCVKRNLEVILKKLIPWYRRVNIHLRHRLVLIFTFHLQFRLSQTDFVFLLNIVN